MLSKLSLPLLYLEEGSSKAQGGGAAGPGRGATGGGEGGDGGGGGSSQGEVGGLSWFSHLGDFKKEGTGTLGSSRKPPSCKSSGYSSGLRGGQGQGTSLSLAMPHPLYEASIAHP